MIYLSLVTSLCPPVSIYCSLPGSSWAPSTSTLSRRAPRLYKPPYFLGTVPDGPASPRNFLPAQVGHPVNTSILSRIPPCLYKPLYFSDTVPDGPAPPRNLLPPPILRGNTVFFYRLHLPVKCNSRLSDYYRLTLDCLLPRGSPWSRWCMLSAVVHTTPVESLQEFNSKVRSFNTASFQSQFPLDLAALASLSSPEASLS